MNHVDDESKPTINIAPYISRFVRCLHVEDDHPEVKLPYSYSQFGAVLMVDIVGFSQMTSIASSKGDVGAEMLSSQIGAYFDIAIRIIEYHGGDVVKFLGDALLVAFQSDPPPDCLTDTHPTPTIPEDETVIAENSASTLKRNKMTVRKAIECSQELLVRLSDYKIYLSEKEFSRKLSCSSSGSEELIYEDENNSGNPSTSAINGAQGNTSPGSHIDNTASPASVYGIGIDSQSHSVFSSTTSLGYTGSVSSRRSSLTDACPSQRASLETNQINRSNTFGNHKFHKKQASWHAGAGSLSIHPFHIGPSNISDRSTNPSPTKPSINPLVYQRTREDSIKLSPTPSTFKLKGRLSLAFSRFTRSNSIERSGPSVSETLHDNALMTKDSIELKLHMALSAGEISNVIIGDIGLENGYYDTHNQPTGRLEYAICGEQMATIEDALSLAQAGEITLTQSIWKYVNTESFPKSEARENCIILKNYAETFVPDLPVPRRVRNDKLLNTPVASNQHYFKYLNRSAIHRLMLYPDGAFPAQFRNATILFVCLGELKPWVASDLEICQRAMLIIQKLISKYEGFIQQFAVDDKGATLLCAFGLPFPRSHENEAIFATKTAWLIRKFLLSSNIRGFKISLATGVIFTSSIGNEFRRDPAIVGDTIVVAVRILKFEYAKESIVCDDATMQACTADHDGLCSFEYMGEEYVKGKTHPIPIWRLTHFGARQQVHRPDDITIDETIGYEPERDKVFNFVDSWSKSPDRNTLLVMGPRGSGKCLFYQQISHLAEGRGYSLCVARTAEVEQSTEYFPLKFLMLSFFRIMLSDEIPYSNKAESSTGIQSSNLKDYFEFRSSASHLNLNSEPSLCPNKAYSPSINQYYDTFGCDSKKQTKLQAIISLCLAKLGIKGRAMSMLKIDKVISAISSENSVITQKPEDDKILADFVVSILNYASQFVKIIVILEDTQWSDFKTTSILKIIHERCPSILIVLFSRPQRDYGCDSALRALTNHPTHLSIILEGLKPWEIEQALLRAFKPNGVNRISPEVMELVQEQTNGNPKFVKNMSMMLKEYCHVNVVNGELLVTGKGNGPSGSKAAEEMLQKQDRKKVTLMQYDRISPRFQDFLKVAACLGENFSLAEIGAIKNLNNLLGQPDSKNSYSAAISALDTFKLLSLATDQQSNIQFSVNSGLQTIYTFRSPSTAHDIYDSIPYEERVVHHLRMAQFYESFLENQPQYLDPAEKPLYCQDLLPKICNHYMKTDATEKKINYLKILASFYLKSNMLTESTEKIDQLITILDNETDAERTVSQDDLAEIYGMKGESLSRRMQIEEAVPALMNSLKKYGISWPATKNQIRREIMKESLKFKYYFRCGMFPAAVKSGMKPQQFKRDPKVQQKLTRIVRVLSCIQNTYYWATDNDSAMLMTLYTLNFSRKLGVPSSDQTTSLARIALLNYFSGHKHEYGKLMAEARRRNDAGDTTGGMLETIEAYIEYNEGRKENAHRLLDEAINESKTFGVVMHLATFYRAVTQKIAYRIWEGAINNHQDDWQLLRTLSAVAMQNGGSEGETLFAIPTVSSLLIQNRIREAESWVFLIERFILPKARLINLVAVFGILAYYYAKVKNYQRSRTYIKLHSQKIEEQACGAHPFPLLSCMFSLMAMFEIYNTSWVPSGTISNTVLPINVDHSKNVINSIIRYLHTDPLKSVSNPLICLADMLKSLLSNSHKADCAQKLIHGYHEFGPSLEGIGFVKAYILAQIARYCAPEHKQIYHSQAQKLFDSMSVNPAAWLSNSTSQRSAYGEENQLDALSDRTIYSVGNTDSNEELRWSKTRETGETEIIRTLKEPSLSPSLTPSIIVTTNYSKTSQNEAINQGMKISSGVEFNEGSFGDELAAASRAPAPSVHSLNGTPDQSRPIQGSATPA